MQTTKTTCPYCGVGCGVLVQQDTSGKFSVKPDPEHPANLGRLCSKGTALAETLDHPDRLLYPEIHGQRVSWDEATRTIANRFRSIIEEHGADAVAFYVSGQLLTEDYYVANKLMKGFIGSANIDTNSRLCMSSAVAAHKRAFGEDLVPCSYADLEQAQLIVLVGSNTAWCHPVLYQRMVKAKKANPALQVVTIDPRRTQTADLADLHLGLAPGTDASLFNGLLAWLAANGHTDTAFVSQSTNGMEQAVAMAQTTAPNVQAVAEQCRLPVEDVQRFFDLFARTDKVVTVFSQGINQSSSGVDKGNAIINCHLLTGRIGKPGAGAFSFTGQPNAMGGREVGGLANQLAAHLDIDNPQHRDLVQRFWQSPRMAQQSGLKAVDLFRAIEAGKVKAVWIMATNPVVSLPDSDQVRRALAQCELVVVSDCVRHTDTLAWAHIRLPALTWGERNGTVTNSDRTISRQRPFLPAPGEAKQDWEIIRDVAWAMGYAAHFPYDSAHDIFCEHAALSTFENTGGRCFNIGAWQDLSALEYDALPPTQWPLDATGQGTQRLFADGKFFTASGKAQFIAVQPRLPQSLRSAEYPFVLNTGRVRDHWHTLTRTGISARLSAHKSEPYVEMHPCDARDQGLQEGTLARLHNPLGELLVRVKTSREQQRGSLFVPMHWSGQFSAAAGVGRLIPAVVDPISGQPEAKHATVAIVTFAAGWCGFLIARRKLSPVGLPPHPNLPPQGGKEQETCPSCSSLPSPLAGEGLGMGGYYWSIIKVENAWRYELSGNTPSSDWAAFARELLCQNDDAVNWTEYFDTARQTYRAARFVGGQLESCLFISASADVLPAREWLVSLFAHETLQPQDRISLLAGKPTVVGEDKGRMVCACFNVGEKTIRKAIAEQGLDSVEAIGRCLNAGTNCGSCVPELKALLA
ncbi:MAG TPA: molybdopterin-dependent oxidoreductase [Candidatus Thiothrix moscowensis]|uniref:nitrate reductase n=1 Tax=unclassified Thiothrix TaxID=2636184 RepID=UPI0025D47420|nr:MULTISPECIES: nitrate reductase [unclassified Thiothrix]HRJ53923.1 molybdopterin-dependent oxidoreductase [Candidatus Thiothrix moscowensis]HRJ94005.1 molybdopterin-dependent oxidoreductase [Candidatus Thiothrix moscowensis]